MTEPLMYRKSSGATITRLIDKMEKALEDEDEKDIMAACLVLALCIQMPDITQEQLESGVKGVSEWIAMFGAETMSPTTKEKMN